MKRIVTSLLLAFCFVGLIYADFSVEGVEFEGVSPDDYSAMDTVFVVKSTDLAELSYTSESEAMFVWYAYDADGNKEEIYREEEPVTETTIPLLDKSSSGYILEIDGDENKSLWVFSYDALAPTIKYVFPYTELADSCSYIQLNFGKVEQPMEYVPYGYVGMPFEVEQQFHIRYDSTYFDTENKVFKTEEIEYVVPNKAVDISVPSPLTSTCYTLWGNQFSAAFNDTVMAVSDTLEAYAVETHVFGRVRVREYATNEKDRGEPEEPTETTDENVLKLEGSAPLNFEALSYSSDAAFHYEWCVSKDRAFGTCMIKSRDKDFRYTFNEMGTYYVQIQVSNDAIVKEYEGKDFGCTQIREFQVDVMESLGDSLIKVPNVFTPNGDGKNDQFKVVYRSITDFHGWIYSLWGRKVYEWTDPAEGWDGTINGKPAADSAYMYIIEATGYLEDGSKKKITRKGSVSIVR